MASSIENKMKCEDITIVISDDDDDDISKPSVIETNVRKRKRKVAFNAEKLIITQQVKVQKVKCVINLTNNNNNSEEIISDVKKLDTTLPDINTSLDDSTERKVPICVRKRCRHTTMKPRGHNPKKNNGKPKRKHRHNCSPQRDSYFKFQISPIYTTNYSNTEIPLSPISLSPLPSDLSYEDISLDSFTSCSETSESDLDTLIKRTKEREKQTSCYGQTICFANHINGTEEDNIISNTKMS